MRNSATFCALVVAATLSATASAQIVSVGPFTGDLSDSFETQTPFQFTPCVVPDIFQGAGQLCDSAGNAAHVTTGWSFVCVIYPHSGNHFSGCAGAYYIYTFNQDVSKFGGYFGVNSGYPDATFNFYDVNNNLLGTQTATIPADCSWNWNGWESQGAPIRKIECIGLNPYGGGFVDTDDIEIKLGGGGCSGNVASYCTAGTTSSGCNATISGSGTPSATATSGFDIDIDNVEGQKQGIIFYGINNTGFNPTPWGVGGTSYLCVKAPLQRTGVQNSGGTTGACDGSLSLDWNAYRANNATALGNPFSAGQSVYAQGWFRDPPSPKTTSLSDGLSFVTCP
jgi:hypothetical protein